MQPFYLLSSLKFSTRIDCVDSNEQIQQAYDVDGDGKYDLYVCNNVIFGNKNFVGHNITINNTAASININNQQHNFTAQDGISIDSLNYGAGGAFFIGDINNNKKGDIAIGMSRYGYLERGQAVVLKNNLPNGKYTRNIILNNDEHLVKIEGGAINDNTNNVGYYVLGSSITSIGDVNKDGYPDFAISSSNNVNSVICVIYGNSTYTEKTITAAYLTPEQGYTINFHYPHHHTPKSADLNGDGFPDVIVAATRYYYSGDGKYGKVDLGQFEVFYGKQNNSFINSFNMSASIGHKFNTPNITDTQYSNVEYPYYIDTIKDTSGNGFGSILLGSPAANLSAGMVRIIKGRSNLAEIDLINSANDTLITHIHGEKSGDEFGSLVANIGDINNDNITDFVICAAGAYNNTGACYVFYGRETWPKDFYVKDMTAEDGFIVKNPDSSSNLAGKVVPLNDFNGDNINDFAISTKDGKVVYIIYGKNGKYNEDDITVTQSMSATASGTVSGTVSAASSGTVSSSATASRSTELPITKTEVILHTESATISSSVSASSSHTVSGYVSGSNTIIPKLVNDVTVSLEQPQIKESENLFPTAVSSAMANVNEYGTVARIAAVNPTSISQGIRTDSIRKLTQACNADGDERYEFDIFSNPLNFAVEATGAFANWNQLKSAANTVMGNNIALISATFVHFIVHRNIPDKSHFPGALILPVLSLITPTLKAGALIFSEADNAAKLTGIASFLPVAASVATFVKFKNNFDDTNEIFKNNYGFLYNGYNDAYKFAMPLDLGMNALIGIASGIKFSNDDSCGNAIYINTAIYTANALSVIMLRPYNSKAENGFAIVTSSLQAVPLLIASAQQMFPDIKDNSLLNIFKETLPTITDLVVLAKTVLDLGTMFNNRFCSSADSDSSSTTSDPLLTVPDHTAVTVSPSTSRESSPDGVATMDYTAVPINNPLTLAGQDNVAPHHD